MAKRARRGIKERLETRYRVASQDQEIKEILRVIETEGKLSDSQKAYALIHFRMVKRALAVARLPFVVERVVGSFFYKRGKPYPMPNKVRLALSSPATEMVPVAAPNRAPSHRPTPRSSLPTELAAPTQADIDAFYVSWDWARLRYRAIQKSGRTCMCCGASAADGAKIHVDHIKPVRRFWHLRLDPDNLQVLCEPCNMGKGSWDETDFRTPETGKPAAWRPGDEGPPPWVN